MTVTVLEGGFDDAPRQAAVAFRGIMDAMARPGRIYEVSGALPPVPVSVAAGVILLTLCDPETPVYLAGATDTPELRQWLAFHTGAPVVGPETCAFALGAWEDLMPLDRYLSGTPQYPDRSATLIVEMNELSPKGTRLSGPGIETEARLNLPAEAVFAENNARFPLGLDFMFTASTRIAALPRSTRIG